MIAAYHGNRSDSGLARQFQYQRTESRIGGSIRQYPTRFVANSPIFRVDRVRTPVMILQNGGGDAVPWYRGIELFLRLEQCFDHFLKGPRAPGRMEKGLPYLERERAALSTLSGRQ